MKILIQIWAIALLSPIVILLLFPASLIAIPFNKVWRVKIMTKPWQLFSWLTLRLGSFAKIHSDDRRSKDSPKNTGLYISNHLSFMDIPLMISQIQVAPVMKKEILYIPFVGLAAYLSGSVTVDRKSPGSRKKALIECKQRLDEGFPIQLYPEGSRSKTDNPKPLEEIKPRLLQLAYRSNHPVTPISLYGTNKVLSKKGLINPFEKIGIIIHEVITPDQFDNEDEFVSAAWNKVLEGYTDLKTKLKPA